jgi:transposase
MSQKEVGRAVVLAKVKDQRITLKQAAVEIALSYPQTKRLWSRYKREGLKGLISRKRGVKSNRAIPQQKRKEIIQIILNKYKDWGVKNLPKSTNF